MGFFQRIGRYSLPTDRDVVDRGGSGGGGGSRVYKVEGVIPLPDFRTIDLNSDERWQVADEAITPEKIEPQYESALVYMHQARHAVAAVADLPDPPGTDEWVVLVVNDALADNGLWVVTGDGAGGSTSARDPRPIRRGTMIFVEDDDVFGDNERSLWVQLEPGPIVVGTDNQSFERVGASPILYGDTTTILSPGVADHRVYSGDGFLDVVAQYSTVAGRSVPGWNITPARKQQAAAGPGALVVANDTGLVSITGLGPFPITLPPTANYPAYQEIIIQDETGALSAPTAVTVGTSPGDTFAVPPGATTFTFNTPNQTAAFYHAGTTWHRIR